MEALKTATSSGLSELVCREGRMKNLSAERGFEGWPRTAVYGILHFTELCENDGEYFWKMHAL